MGRQGPRDFSISALKPISVQNDIEIRGRKISGTGGTELSGAILFQGTVLIDFDVDEMLRALRIPTEKLQDKEIESVKERVTCLKWEMSRPPSLPEIKSSLARGFGEVFGVAFLHQPLTDKEQTHLKRKLDHFASPDHIFKVREPLPRRKTVTSIIKAPGGLIRISIAIDSKTRVIQQLLITGDFFAYPKRAVFDLESLFKNSKASPSHIEEIIRSFFKEKRPVIPGIREDHLIRAVGEAVQKIDLLPHGFDEEDTHHLFPVLKPFKEVRKPEVLLLPYCAKEVECSYRNLLGCDECGRCTVGVAAQMARSSGWIPSRSRITKISNPHCIASKAPVSEVLSAHAAIAFMENIAPILNGLAFPEFSSMSIKAPVTI